MKRILVGEYENKKVFFESSQDDTNIGNFILADGEDITDIWADLVIRLRLLYLNHKVNIAILPEKNIEDNRIPMSKAIVSIRIVDPESYKHENIYGYIAMHSAIGYLHVLQKVDMFFNSIGGLEKEDCLNALKTIYKQSIEEEEIYVISGDYPESSNNS